MRRARISIKPNVRPGGRSVAPTSQESAVDNTQQTDRPSPSPHSHLEVIEPAVAKGDGNLTGCPSEKASVNIGNGVPSSASKPATTAPQRRSRIFATPILARPKAHSVPSPVVGKTASLPSEPFKEVSSLQTAKSFPEASIPNAVSRDDSQTSTFSYSNHKQTPATINSSPSSPCLPSSSGVHESSVPVSPSFKQPQRKSYQTPKQIPMEDSGSQEGAGPALQILSPYVKLSHCDEPGSPQKSLEMSDKQRVLRDLKLKELIKLERRKELMKKKKSGRCKFEHSEETDPSKMTLADFIYYLPETNPMRSSLSTEQTQGENIVPPSLKVTTKQAETDEEDDDAEDELMVPKVRVAEDGTLILDEDSLTVRVQRKSDTVVENATPLFERGSTTTYASFRKQCFVKTWSVRETDMFYLAISMVGTDFSMMAQLLTHRTRTEIKSKFKKEEKTNAWRVDKACRNKRPFDSEFFSFLLKRILEKDKKRGRSIKLVVKANKAKKGKGGKKAKKHEEEDIIDDDDDDDMDGDELDIGDSDFLDLEKENEDSVEVTDITSCTSRKRKRKTGKTCKPKKNNKKSKQAGGKESECLHVEDDSVNAENEDPALMSVSKKKRKRSRKGDEMTCEGEPEEKHKTKRKKKTMTDKVQDAELVDVGEIEASVKHKSADPSKKCKHSKKDKREEEPAKGKRKTKKSKKSQEECAENKLDADNSEVSTAGPDAGEDQGETVVPETAAQKETSQRSLKCLKRPLPNLPKRKAKKCSEQKATVEDEDMPRETRDENCRETEIEFQINSLAENQLQKQAVVVVERTPPRLIKALSSCESPGQPQTSHSLQDSPERQTRAEKVKCNLTASDRGMKETGKMDECQTDLRLATSAEEMRSTAMACQEIIQKPNEMEEDQSIEEGVNLRHLEFMTLSEVNGQMFLKRPVVMVSHEEVEHYLRVQNAKENSSESQLDAESVERHMDSPECSSSVILENRVSKDPEMKESASISFQQCVPKKRSRFTKPTPNLSRSSQTFQRSLNKQTSESDENLDSLCFNPKSTQLQCSGPVNDTMKLNKCTGSPEEHAAFSETIQDKVPEDVKDQNDALTTINDDISFTSNDEIPALSEDILSFLEKPHVLPTTLSDEDVAKKGEMFEISQSETSEHKEQITNLEDYDLELDKSKVKEIINEEPQKEMKMAIISSCSESAEGSSDSAKQSSTPERHRFCKSTPDQGQASQIMICPHQITEHHEDSVSEIADKPGCQSPAKGLHCELDLNIKNISTEDEFVFPEVNLQEHKQAKDLLSRVQLLDPKQTVAPTVPVDNTTIGNKEICDMVLTDAFSASPETQLSPISEVLDLSFSKASNDHPSNTWDMNTMLFCETTAEDVQISDTFGEDINSMGRMQPSNSDLVQQDSVEKLSKASEDCSAPLKGNLDMFDSAGVERGATKHQTEEEPTFILTLYEIPTSQLLQEASFGQQTMLPYELQPAEVQTPLLLSGDSQSLPSTLEDSSSALLHMKSKEMEKPWSSVSQEVVDDSSVPVSEDAVKDANTRLVSSLVKSFDADSSFGPVESQEILTYNASMATDVTSVLKVDEKPSQSTETKAPPQRRSKIKVKPNLRLCMKVGPSKVGQSECASSQKTTAKDNLATSHAIAQVEMERNQETSVQETAGTSLVPNIYSHPEDGERGTHPGHEGLSTANMPVFEDEKEKMMRLSDVADLHSTAIEESNEEAEDGCGGVLTSVFVDALGLASRKMEDERRVQKCEDSESEKPVPTVNDQEKMKEPDTYREASCVTSASQGNTVPFRSKLQVKPKFDLKTTCTKDESLGQEQCNIGPNQSATTSITLEPQIKEESDKVEQEDCSDNSKRDLGTVQTLTEEVMETKPQLTPLTTANTSIHAEIQPVEKKTEDNNEDISHMVISDVSVVVLEEKVDELHTESKSSPHHIHLDEDPYGCALKKQQSLKTEEYQERDEHECVSHMVLDDIIIPVSEEMENDLGKEKMTDGEERSHGAERSQAIEYADVSRPLHAVSESMNVEPSVSPKKETLMRRGTLKVQMMFPERSGEPTESVEQSEIALAESSSTLRSKQQEILTLRGNKGSSLRENESSTKNSNPYESEVKSCQENTQCSVKETCADLPSVGLKDTEAACEGVSHMVLSDVLVPVLDETVEMNLHKENLLVSLQHSQGVPSENALEVKQLVVKKPLNLSVSMEQKMPSFRRDNLQKTAQTAQQSMDPQAVEEWSLKSDMLPMDSNEIENWCEGVSHMLLSDAFVPVSEEENSTNPKVLVAGDLHEDIEHAISLSECKEATENTNKVHQLDSVSGMQKIEKPNKKLPTLQTKKSPGRQSTLQMTMRSPERSPKSQPSLLKSSQAVSTPKQTKTSKEELQSPAKEPKEGLCECRIQLERLSLKEIFRHNLQPKHHSTPVNIKTISKVNESRSTDLEAHVVQDSAMPSGCWPKVVLNRISIKGTDVDTPTPTSSPARMSTTASQQLGDCQSPLRNPHNSSLDVDDEPAVVSQFFLDDIFTEVVDPD